MKELLSTLASLPGVRGAVLVDRDGLVVGSSMSSGADAEELAAIGASVFGSLDRAVQQVNLGTVVDSIVQTSECSIQMLGAGQVVLIVIADRGMNVAQVRLEMRRIANHLAEQRLA